MLPRKGSQIRILLARGIISYPKNWLVFEFIKKI